MADTREWHYIRKGVQKGPVPDAGLGELVRVGVLPSDVLVWTNGMSTWETAEAALPRYSAEVDLAPSEAVEYFPVSTLKFLVMDIATGGIYELYWFYKNWKYLKVRFGFKLSPFWRTFFAPLFCYDLMKRVREDVSARVPADYAAGWLATAYFLLNMAWRLPDQWSYVGYLTFLPLLPVVWAVNDANRHRVSSEAMNGRFSGWNIAMIVVFILLRALDVVFWIRPELLPS